MFSNAKKFIGSAAVMIGLLLNAGITQADISASNEAASAVSIESSASLVAFFNELGPHVESTGWNGAVGETHINEAGVVVTTLRTGGYGFRTSGFKTWSAGFGFCGDGLCLDGIEEYKVVGSSLFVGFGPRKIRVYILRSAPHELTYVYNQYIDGKSHQFEVSMQIVGGSKLIRHDLEKINGVVARSSLFKGTRLASTEAP